MSLFAETSCPNLLLIVPGHYNFGERLAACRDDYCTYCRKPVFWRIPDDAVGRIK